MSSADSFPCTAAVVEIPKALSDFAISFISVNPASRSRAPLNPFIQAGSAGLGCLTTHVRCPSFPLPSMANFTDWAHSRLVLQVLAALLHLLDVQVSLFHQWPASQTGPIPGSFSHSVCGKSVRRMNIGTSIEMEDFGNFRDFLHYGLQLAQHLSF